MGPRSDDRRNARSTRVRRFLSSLCCRPQAAPGHASSSSCGRPQSRIDLEDACLGVKVNSKRFGNVPRKARLLGDARGVIVEHEMDARARRVVCVGQLQEFDEFRAATPFADQTENLARQQTDAGQQG